MKRAGLEDGRPAQRDAGAGNGPNPERRAEGCGLEAQGGASVAAVDNVLG